MSKYHINSKGNPGKCSAADGNCPFGAAAPHYETEAEARKAYEIEMQSTSKKTFLSPTSKTFEEYSADSDAWLASLSEEERTLINNYVNQGYTEINESLWNDGEITPEIELLDSIVAKSEKKTRKLYRKPPTRRMDRETFSKEIAKMQPGQRITFKGYTSTTEEPAGIMPLLVDKPTRPEIFQISDENFRQLDQTWMNVVFEIEADNGVPPGSEAFFSREREWLLPRNQSFEVVEHQENVEISGSFTGQEHDYHVRTVTLIKLKQLKD